MSPLASQEFRIHLYDAKRGLVSNLSDQRIGNEPDYYKRSTNWLFEQPRSLTVRGGSRALSSATMAAAPHSLGKYRPTSGTTAVFAGRSTAIVLASSVAYTVQTMPGAAAFAGKPLRFEQLNDVLFVTEHLGANKPFGFVGSGWVAVALPVVAPAPSIAVGAAGGVDIGVHFYRVRHVFANGSSVATAIGSVNPGVASIINIGNPPGPNALPTVAPGGRPDWLFWALERTKANAPLGVNDKYYFVDSGVAATYADTKTDNSLFDLVSDGWYTAPPIFNGTIAYADRMFGWIGSLLYPSWAIGQKPFLGIYNFDPLNALRVGADDGDIIQTAVRAGGNVVLFKSRSHHFLYGRDLNSFTISTADEGGASGPRAACVAGDGLFFYNDAGLFRLKAGGPEPFGWVEAGYYLSQINPAARDKVILRAIGQRYLFVGYPVGTSVDNTEALTYDFRTRTWAHHDAIEAADLLYQQDTDFGSARAIAACGIDQGVNQFQLFALFDGTNDKRASDGSGGVAVAARAETPLLDAGDPTVYKEVERIEGDVESSGGNLSLSISSPELAEPVSVTLIGRATGKSWAADVVAAPDDLTWDNDDWAPDDEEASTPSGVPRGVLCKRFRISVAAAPSVPLTFHGATVDGKLRPERRMV